MIKNSLTFSSDASSGSVGRVDIALRIGIGVGECGALDKVCTVQDVSTQSQGVGCNRPVYEGTSLQLSIMQAVSSSGRRASADSQGIPFSTLKGVLMRMGSCHESRSHKHCATTAIATTKMQAML